MSSADPKGQSNIETNEKSSDLFLLASMQRLLVNHPLLSLHSSIIHKQKKNLKKNLHLGIRYPNNSRYSEAACADN